MIDKDRIILDQQKKIERIEKLQEELHTLAMIGMFTLKVVGVPDDDGLLENTMDTIHNVSHAITDVLEGMAPKKAIKENLTGKGNKEEEEED
ncbi:hypothetical protein VYH76_07910 [Streptococcus anginosus]|nr:hypothetical protein [Streptococcus anginosus]HEP2609916.1 hypothetical protein [Streptococcus pyogenes]MED5855137.1 hypothetical protein [Streptococcus anginosus]MED5968420.1 hypothetical protein [Streptococcus anginosus]HEQ8148692.1 hypothetical protein [Streptococcus pyogenes]